MKIKIILILLAFNISLLTAQNVFIWDRDGGSEISDPEDPWSYIGLEAGIKAALTANNIFPVIDTLLANDLFSYDIIFATVGIWCAG
jgi:hypothetical protein